MQIIIGNTSSSGNSFSCIFDPPPLLKGKLCLAQLRSFYVSDILIGRSCEVKLSGLSAVPCSYDTRTNSTDVKTIGMFQNHYYQNEQPRFVVQMPDGPVNLDIQLLDLDTNGGLLKTADDDDPDYSRLFLEVVPMNDQLK